LTTQADILVIRHVCLIKPGNDAYRHARDGDCRVDEDDTSLHNLEECQ